MRVEKRKRIIEGYVTANDMTERWNLSPRTIQIMYVEERIRGVTMFGNAQDIVSDAKKPTDNRVVSGKHKNRRKNFQKNSE